MYVFLKYSKHGYELSVVGESENTAKYIGINVKKVIIRTMLLSGAVCGIAGDYAGVLFPRHRKSTGFYRRNEGVLRLSPLPIKPNMLPAGSVCFVLE